MVYNWKNHTWRIGGQVPVSGFTLQACGLIKDPRTGRNNILVTGGVPVQSVTPIPPTWLWDPSTGNIQNVTAFPTEATYGTRMVRFSEYEVLVLSPQDGLLHSFTVDDSWKRVTSMPRGAAESVAPMLVPKGLFKCQIYL